MSDLIDRKKLLEERPEWLNINHVDNSEFNKGWNDCNDYWLKVINKQPIAYDPENIIKQLESYRDKRFVSGITNDAWEFGACHSMDIAIEIIKQGCGIDD